MVEVFRIGDLGGIGDSRKVFKSKVTQPTFFSIRGISENFLGTKKDY